METVRIVILSAAVAAGMLLIFGSPGEPVEEPMRVEDWRMFSGEDLSTYIYDTRTGDVFRVHGPEDPKFPEGYVARVPFAYRDEMGNCLRAIWSTGCYSGSTCRVNRWSDAVPERNNAPRIVSLVFASYALTPIKCLSVRLV